MWRSVFALFFLFCLADAANETALMSYPKVSSFMDIAGFIAWLYQTVVDIIAATTSASYPTDVDVYTCILGMKHYLSGVSKGEIWALSMIDATAKLQSGFLIGNFINLGQYDQCVNVDSGYVKGMHCLTDIKITLPDNFTIDSGGTQVPISSLLGSNVLTLTMGQCFPSSCKPWVIQSSYSKILYGFNKLFSQYRIDIGLDEKDCHVKYRAEYSTTEWVVMIFVLFAVFITSICTTADVFSLKDKIRNRRPYPGEQMVLAFSAYSNWNKLISTSKSSGSITCINGLKALSIAWVVLAHKYRYLITQPVVNLLSIPEELKNWTKMLLESGTLAVDTFFMISGLLNMYAFCTVRSKKRSYTLIDILIGYVHRFLRLTPAYAIMIAITATWLYRTGNGPVWDRIIGTASGQCQTDWWYNLVYLNNYINPDSYCMMQSWYLAADMQLFWLSPLVLYPLWRWPWFGCVEILILTVAAIAVPFSISYFDEIKTPIPLSADPAVQSRIMDEMYLPTHTKAVAYVIGILTGYLLYQMKEKKIEFKMNKIVASILWILTPILMLYSIFGAYQISQLDHPYNKVESAIYIGFFRFFWSLGLMWIIMACANDYSGPINSILSWEPFAFVSRLTYSIYLTHIAVILYGLGSMRQSTFYTDYGQVQTFFGDFFISIMCATVLSLLLESPLMAFEKIIFGGARTGNRTRSRKADPEAEPPIRPSDISGGERLNY